jgi:cysteinyl-tRNA synthetase
MIAMIADLIAKSHAYAAEGHVLFRVRSYAEYGALSGRSVDDMIAGARVEVAPYKEDPLDFVLWKPSTPDLPGWDSPWGRGRPGWHIECSAMSHELLGESFDIHGGGIDLQFPHHENEIAQSACAHPEAGFANVWLHNEMLLVEGRKMSKSLGNFFTVRDLLDQGVPGEVIRYVFLMTHYRKPMDWTAEKVQEAKKTLEGWYNLTDGVQVDRSGDWWIVDALEDDLNTPAALSRMHQLANARTAGRLKSALRLLGMTDAENLGWWREEIVTLVGTFSTGTTPLYLDVVAPFLRRWQDLRIAKNYAAADELKRRLEETGLRISNSKSGPTATIPHDFDPAKLEALK